MSRFVPLGLNLDAVFPNQVSRLICSKHWQITRPGFAIRQKLADSEIICVSTNDKSMVIIRLNPNSNNYILDNYWPRGRTSRQDPDLPKFDLI